MSDEDDKKRLLPPEKAREIDHQLRGKVALATRGMSPVDIAAAVVDWALRLIIVVVLPASENEFPLELRYTR